MHDQKSKSTIILGNEKMIIREIMSLFSTVSIKILPGVFGIAMYYVIKFYHLIGNRK